MFKVGYAQYPIQQFVGADSAIVTSKGGMQGRFVNVVFVDTLSANQQRIKQYPGAMIYAAGKMWVRNTTATGWTELAYGPISTTNIYNSNGTLTGNRDLDGGGYNLTFSSIGGEFGVGADSINFVPASGKFRISSLNQGIGSKALRYDPVTKLLSYSDTTSSLNIYNSDGTLTGNRELDGNSNNLTFTAVKKFEFSGDSLYYILDPAGNLRIKLGNQQLTMQGDTASLTRRLSYTANLGSSFTKHSLVDKNYVDSIGVLSPTGSGTTNYVPKWTGSTALGNSQIFDNGTSVGIGTASPSASYLLDVVGKSRFTNTTSDAFVIDLGTTGIFKVLRNSVSHLQYDANTFTTTAFQLTSQNLNTYNSNQTRISGGVLQFTGGAYINAISQELAFWLGGSEKARFTTNGRLLIGTTTESTYELDVVGDIRSTLDANINGLTVGKGGGSVANNTAIGSLALNSNTTGDYNTAVGRQSLNSNTTGVGNIALGWATGLSQQTGNYNLYLGYGAGFYDRGSNNIFLGFQAGYHFTFSTSSNNIGIGYYALNNVDAGNNIALGNQASKGITTGIYNTIVGTNANTSNGITTGNYNTIIGSQITGLSSSLANHTIIADGQGNMRLVAFNDGNVYIGGSTTLPTNAGYKLDVNGTGRVSGNFTISGPAGSVTNVDIFGGTTGGSGQTLRIYGSTPTTQGLFLTYTTATAESFIDAGYHTTSSGASFGDIIFRSKKNATNTLAENMRIRGFDGNVLIGTSTNDASAIVNISSTTKGFLPPRMTNAQMVAIATPAAGLVVYDTTNNKLNVYDGTNWVTLH
jgi:hypothetical protein